ncbi:aminoacyl-tRNA hydrolase [Lichenifustis flavocetrariae]|uniref:Peptidyl-tRNA hydrolase n=1 Tax=Lichenifustis flavocetrariae TaxID=2949735 RepID=A0AA41YUD0_9HYPH|nr:aminoacyl-tRNA hydrolase [Lichenifustis flavocetrariae]MCW6507033.1 aminoacyl-tRNA hydrolase [Lichenifustis flavocetrariae]
MLIFAGLGNPGSQYSGNRHNIGFMAIDAIARLHRFPAFRTKFQGLASEGLIDGERVLLLKPTTFMNESGRAVGDAARFYKVGMADTVVFHDELDLDAGRLRVKVGGGNAGHNGLRSITALCGNDYKRVRLGIGHPGDKALVHAYVLSDFAKDERPWVRALCEAVANDVGLLVGKQDATFQNKVFRATEAELPKA